MMMQSSFTELSRVPFQLSPNDMFGQHLMATHTQGHEATSAMQLDVHQSQTVAELRVESDMIALKQHNLRLERVARARNAAAANRPNRQYLTSVEREGLTSSRSTLFTPPDVPPLTSSATKTFAAAAARPPAQRVRWSDYTEDSEEARLSSADSEEA